jgi:hypothetical protein
MLAAVLVALAVAAVVALAYNRGVRPVRGPLDRSASRRYDSAYERSRRRPDRG